MIRIALHLVAILNIVIVTILSSAILYAAQDQNISARTSSSSSSQKHEELRFEDLDFSWTGRPNKQTAGGSRPYGCPQANGTLTALVPKNMGFAVSKSTTFWFYVPYRFQDVENGEFVLQQANGEADVHRTPVTLSHTPGIIGIRLPPSLEDRVQLNQPYLWSFLVFCNPENTDVNVFVEGWVQWTNREPMQRGYVHYAHKRIWHDALTDLAEHRRQAPQDTGLKNDWLALLKSVGLADLVGQPLVTCCVGAR